ncbi:Methyltransferase domain-containing protein [Virgibacillus chiguensis]|uniref:Methyltransferase domain-containing protein n=1 Tax=Virgibacillus chiguensis TaxID=411959 RepID=A0A1M5NQK9_9BACI|nr:Methyltransferase domain-containing protein [Virgibacillus chiguensis]
MRGGEGVNYLESLAKLGVGGAHPGGLKLTKEIVAQQSIDHTTKLLDIGCGTGQTAAFIANQYACSVTAMDIHPIMVEKAKQRFLDGEVPISVVQGNIEQMCWSEQFDIVLSESVLAFTNISKSLTSIRNVLKCNGCFLAVEIMVDESVGESDKHAIASFYGFRHLLTETEWREKLSQSSFKQINIEQPSLNPLPITIDEAQDFHFSNSEIDEALDILHQHQALTKRYKEKLPYAVFRCTK